MKRRIKVLTVTAFLTLMTGILAEAQTTAPAAGPTTVKKARKSRSLSSSSSSPSSAATNIGTPAAAASQAPTTGPVPAGAHLKKDGTVDKRYKASQAAPMNSAATSAGAVQPQVGAVNQGASKSPVAIKAPVVQPSSAANVPANTSTPVSRAADQVDNALKGPQGQAVMTGPRGGKYYINKNGKKTYIKKS